MPPPADKSPAGSREDSPTPSVARRRRRAPAQQSLSLAPASAVPEPARGVLAGRLWVGIHLPVLALETLGATNVPPARAVFEDQQGMRRVLLANARAQASGVVTGLSVNAALALLPDLCLEERNPAGEERALKELAGWAERFTPVVCINAPNGLLLEISGSLRIFGGIKALRKNVSKELAGQGFTASIAISPTPLASTWLAVAGRRVCVQKPGNLVGVLAPLPLECMAWPDSVYEALRGMGVTCIGDCLRLPRQGFAKRFGAKRLLELDRALGRLPDPRESYRAPEQFCTDYELPEEQSDSKLLLNVCRELLLKLERFLVHRQLSVQRVQFSFFHLQLPATHLSLGCVQASHAMSHWLPLLKLRFDNLVLPAAAIAIRLRGEHSQPLLAETGSLPFSKTSGRQPSTPIAHLVERLGARIGNGSVHGVMTVAEHRPQYAWRSDVVIGQVPHCAAAPDYSLACSGFPNAQHMGNSLVTRRPLWMLPEPELLAVGENTPVYRGPLKLLDGPERLETGWWDDDGIARDYFVAINPQGVHLWIYRNRGIEPGWYLHGIFG